MEHVNRRSFLRTSGLVGLSVPFGGMLLQGCAPGNSGLPGSAGGDDAVTGDFLLSLPTSNNLYFDGWTEASRAAAAALGLGVKYENYEFDTARQMASFQNVSTLGLTGAITSANSAAASPALMRQLQSQQVPGINTWSNQPWDTPLDVGDYYVGYYETATDTGMEALSTFLFEKMGGSGKVIHISGAAGNLSSDYRDFGVDRALAKYPDIELVGRQYGGYSRVTTTPVVENLLTAHPDVQGIICQNDDSAMGALSVLRSRGIDALVVGGDGIPEFLDAIASGEALATMIHSGPWLGAATTARIFDAMNGVTFEPLDRMLRFEGFVCNTPEAARAYKELMYGSGEFPFDYRKMSRFLYPDDWDMQHAIVPLRPEVYWAEFESKKPSGYELPDAYRDATDADYAAIATMYDDHLKTNPHDQVRALCKPAPISDFPNL